MVVWNVGTCTTILREKSKEVQKYTVRLHAEERNE